MLCLGYIRLVCYKDIGNGYITCKISYVIKLGVG